MTISDLEGIETMNTATPAAAPVPADHPGGRRLTYAQAPLGRLASTGLAFAYMLLAIPALALFIIEVTFIPLVIITVGALVLPLVVPVVAALATLHRRMASRVLGVGSVEAGVGDDLVGATGLAEPVVGVGGGLSRDDAARRHRGGDEGDPDQERAPRVGGAPARGPQRNGPAVGA